MSSNHLSKMGVVHKAPFRDPKFIGFFAPDSVVGRWSFAYRLETTGTRASSESKLMSIPPTLGLLWRFMRGTWCLQRPLGSNHFYCTKERATPSALWALVPYNSSNGDYWIRFYPPRMFHIVTGFLNQSYSAGMASHLCSTRALSNARPRNNAFALTGHTTYRSPFQDASGTVTMAVTQYWQWRLRLQQKLRLWRETDILYRVCNIHASRSQSVFHFFGVTRENAICRSSHSAPPNLKHPVVHKVRKNLRQFRVQRAWLSVMQGKPRIHGTQNKRPWIRHHQFNKQLLKPFRKRVQSVDFFLLFRRSHFLFLYSRLHGRRNDALGD